MISRYSPTYTYKDLFRGLQLSNNDRVVNNLQLRLSEIYQARHVFLLNSARAALYLILKAYERPGGVIMPAYTCIVVPEAVTYAGYKPSFVDIDIESLNLDEEQLIASITQDHTAVIITHLLGIPCNRESIIRKLRQKDVLIIEDGAPALGAKYNGKLVGSFGGNIFADAAILSFQATKVISAEKGGALLTNDDHLANKVNTLIHDQSNHDHIFPEFLKSIGRRTITWPYFYGAAQLAYRILRNEDMYEVVTAEPLMPGGYVKPCSPFASSIVLSQLDRLEWNVSRRRKIASIYMEALDCHPMLKIPLPPENSEPAWIQFPLIVNDKWGFYKYMQRNGIDIAWTYRYSCAESYKLKGYENAQIAARTVVGLPTYPSISDTQAFKIGQTAKKYPDKH